MSKQNKTGRKLKHHVAADGSTIVGLSRRPSDGRWRIIEGKRKGFTFTEADEARAIERFRFLTSDDLDPTNYYKHLKAQQQGVVDWRVVAEEIRKRPQWVAKETGIEWIAYGPELKAPDPLPTFAELERTFNDHFKKGENKTKVLAA
jgi:hypothetical protein